jgi:cation transport regulator ChaC
MKIAVLGWGSLIWDPRNLHTTGEWLGDGPQLPIEFARVSEDGRLTLVLFPSAEKVQVLWNYMNTGDLGEAIENLREREGKRTRTECIGFVKINNEGYRCNVIPDITSDIKQWAKEKSINAVIWTDLPSNFTEFTEGNVVKYLESLKHNSKKRAEAEKYIRKAPPQIKTKMRKVIEERLGWAHEGNYR